MAMPPASLPEWALDKARTLDERHILLLLADACRLLERNRSYEVGKPQPNFEWALGWREQRDAQLRPLELPPLQPKHLQTMVEMIPHFTSFQPRISPGSRYLGEVGEVLRFFTALEELHLGNTSIRDISFLEDLPRLRHLQIASGELEDLRPLRHCTQLKHLELLFSGAGPPHYAPPIYWLDTSPLAALQELETLSFSPNAAALTGLCFPRLTTATFSGDHCVQPDCAHLPDMPALRFLTLSGVQTLRGIHRFPELRHLTISGHLRDFGDLPQLSHLDCLEVNTSQGWPRRLEPLATLPSLIWASFGGEWPRNYWPMAGAPRLCELQVKNCSVVDIDVAAVNAGLPSWDSHFALAEPRPLQPLSFIAVEHGGDTSRIRRPHENPHPDYIEHPKRFELERLWMMRRLLAIGKHFSKDDEAISCRLYCSNNLTINFNIQSIDLARHLPEVIDAVRQAFAGSPRSDWLAYLSIDLRLRYEHMSPEQKKWLKQMQDERDAEDDEIRHEKWKAQQQHLLETQFRLRAAEEEGEEPDPDDFQVPDILKEDLHHGPLITTQGRPTDKDDKEEDEKDNPDFELKPFDEQEQNTDDENGDDSDVTVAPPPTPPPSFFDDPHAHPLADTYRVYAYITEEGLYHHANITLGTLIMLMNGRQPDEYHRAPPKQES